MPKFKKLTFAPIFLITFSILLFLVSPIFKSYDLIFSFSVETFVQILTICILLSLSCFLFVIFATLSDMKITLVVGILASFIPLLFLDMGLGLVFSVGIILSLILTYLNLQNTLKSYLSFTPNAIFGPSIRQLSGLLILSICITFFFSVNKMIAKNGFQIPDSLIDASLSFSPIGSDTPKSLTQDLIKQAVKDQFENLIKPYMSLIPPILALLLFFTFQSITALINLLIYPLLWLTFYILEKTQFITFTTEQRPVKKLIV